MGGARRVGAQHGRECTARGAGGGIWREARVQTGRSHLEKDEHPKRIIIDITSVNVVFIVYRNVCPIA
jgi:hypothetical protein